MVFVWCLCGVCVVFAWCLCGVCVCVVFVWCLCGQAWCLTVYEVTHGVWCFTCAGVLSYMCSELTCTRRFNVSSVVRVALSIAWT